MARCALPRLAKRPFFLAETSWRHVERALEGKIVGGDEHAQIADDVFDLAAAVESRAAVYAVDNAVFYQSLLKHARQMMGAVEDGYVRQLSAAFYEPRYSVGHPFGLGLFGAGVVHEGLVAAVVEGMERLWIAVGVVGDEGVARAYDLGRGAVVGVHDDGSGAGVEPVEVEEQFHVGSAP